MGSSRYFALLCVSFIASESYAAHISKYSGQRGSYNPSPYRYEEIEEYDPDQEAGDLALYQRYSNNLRHRHPLLRSTISTLGVPLQSDTPTTQYITEESMETQSQEFEDNDEDEDDESVIVVATDSKGQKYLIPKKVFYNLEKNGLVNDDGTFLIPNGAVNVMGQQIVDSNSGVATFAISEDSLQDIDADDDDDVLAVTNDDNDDYGQLASILKHHYRDMPLLGVGRLLHHHHHHRRHHPHHRRHRSSHGCSRKSKFGHRHHHHLHSLLPHRFHGLF